MMAEAFVIGLLGGIVGGVLVDFRAWVRIVTEIRAHGFDNHRCDRRGCCR